MYTLPFLFIGQLMGYYLFFGQFPRVKLFVKNFLNCSNRKRKPGSYFSYTGRVGLYFMNLTTAAILLSFEELFGRPFGLSVLIPIFSNLNIIYIAIFWLLNIKQRWLLPLTSKLCRLSLSAHQVAVFQRHTHFTVPAAWKLPFWSTCEKWRHLRKTVLITILLDQTSYIYSRASTIYFSVHNIRGAQFEG